MKILKKITYNDLENYTEIIKVKYLYCLLVFQEGIPEEDIDKLDMSNFVFPGKRNWDWYFSEKVDDDRGYELKNVYFSKEPLEDLLYEYLDFLPDVDLYMYVKIGEVNGYLKNPKQYFKQYLESTYF
ncbi:MAG: hypothetical protein Q8K30_04200 [Candidatus Gracilibacteria bacterium]|nr:hypothetical protein [Candidatus Gracilibacteria bacterium]